MHICIYIYTNTYRHADWAGVYGGDKNALDKRNHHAGIHIYTHTHIYICIYTYTLGLYKIFVCLFGDFALVNIILGIQLLLDCTHPQLYLGINIAQYVGSPRPPCVAIQHTIFAITISCKGQIHTPIWQHATGLVYAAAG